MRAWRRPTVFAIALTVFGVAAFAGLGVWQLRRGAEKEKLFAAFAGAAPVVEFSAARGAVAEASYPRVRVSGHYVADRGYLLDEQMHDGVVGVHAIGVFAPQDGGDALLVDRGWVAWNHAPNTTPDAPRVAQGDVDVEGTYAAYPGGGLRIGGNGLVAQKTWPKLTLYLDPAQIGADLGRPVLARILLLDPAPDSGFVREWKPNVMPPERHRAYAVQWFALALVAIVIFIGRHWREEKQGTNGH